VTEDRHDEQSEKETNVSKLKRIIGIRATKAVAKHTAHGLSAKAQRKPLRSASLLAVGLAVGLAAGWSGGRSAASPS
jgi:uncharacterized protein YfiM (DUF2279 family)